MPAGCWSQNGLAWAPHFRQMGACRWSTLEASRGRVKRGTINPCVYVGVGWWVVWWCGWVAREWAGQGRAGAVLPWAPRWPGSNGKRAPGCPGRLAAGLLVAWACPWSGGCVCCAWCGWGGWVGLVLCVWKSRGPSPLMMARDVGCNASLAGCQDPPTIDPSDHTWCQAPREAVVACGGGSGSVRAIIATAQDEDVTLRPILYIKQSNRKRTAPPPPMFILLFVSLGFVLSFLSLKHTLSVGVSTPVWLHLLFVALPPSSHYYSTACPSCTLAAAPHWCSPPRT